MTKHSGTRTERFSEHWKEFWSNQVGPLHRQTDDEWLRFCASELLLYFPETPCRVLELGCGSGELYETLAHRCSEYTGLDVSQSMLDQFQTRHPNVRLVCGDASKLPLQETFDFVFSRGVCQYFDESMLRQNLERVHALLPTGSSYLIGDIPDAGLRLHFYLGALRGDKDLSLKDFFRHSVADIRGTNKSMGTWWRRRRFSKIAQDHGFSCRTHSSAVYEYRYHALLTKL